jgi:hypothetical protein
MNSRARTGRTADLRGDERVGALEGDGLLLHAIDISGVQPGIDDMEGHDRCRM